MIDCLTPWNLIWNFFHAHQCSEIYNSSIPNDAVSFLDYIPFFLKTYILELPIYFLILRTQKNFLQIAWANLVLNLATHPIVFFVIPLALIKYDANYLQYLTMAEIFAPVVETLLLIFVFKINLRFAFMAALCANLFSWGVGVYWL